MDGYTNLIPLIFLSTELSVQYFVDFDRNDILLHPKNDYERSLVHTNNGYAIKN